MKDKTERTEIEIIRDVSSCLVEASGWMKAFAIIGIIGGVIQCFTVIGIIVAWVPILMGVILFQSASLAEEAKGYGSADKLKASFQKLKSYFMLMVLMPLLGLTLVLIVYLIKR